MPYTTIQWGSTKLWPKNRVHKLHHQSIEAVLTTGSNQFESSPNCFRDNDRPNGDSKSAKTGLKRLPDEPNFKRSTRFNFRTKDWIRKLHQESLTEYSFSSWPTVTRCWCQKVAKSFQKVAQQVLQQQLATQKVTSFKIAQNATNYLDFLWMKSCCRER